jgi:hypothetical protein
VWRRAAAWAAGGHSTAAFFVVTVHLEKQGFMRYDFLIDTYETEGIKVISAWSMFRDDDFPVRPNATDTCGRSLHDHMVHQCVSEDIWFRMMLDIDVGAPPLPQEEVRMEFMRRYEEDSGKRLVMLRTKDEAW